MIGMRDPRMFGGMAGALPPGGSPSLAPAVPSPTPPAAAFAPEAAGIAHLPVPRELAPAPGPAKLPGRMYIGAALMNMGGHGDIAQALMQKRRDELAQAGQMDRREAMRQALAKALIMRQAGG